jgi:hypothetical protein
VGIGTALICNQEWLVKATLLTLPLALLLVASAAEAQVLGGMQYNEPGDFTGSFSDRQLVPDGFGVIRGELTAGDVDYFSFRTPVFTTLDAKFRVRLERPASSAGGVMRFFVLEGNSGITGFADLAPGQSTELIVTRFGFVDHLPFPHTATIRVVPFFPAPGGSSLGDYLVSYAPIGAVPEPTAIGLTLAIIGGALFRSRRRPH